MSPTMTGWGPFHRRSPHHPRPIGQISTTTYRVSETTGYWQFTDRVLKTAVLWNLSRLHGSRSLPHYATNNSPLTNCVHTPSVIMYWLRWKGLPSNVGVAVMGREQALSVAISFVLAAPYLPCLSSKIKGLFSHSQCLVMLFRVVKSNRAGQSENRRGKHFVCMANRPRRLNFSINIKGLFGGAQKWVSRRNGTLRSFPEEQRLI
jgi:hypothetical protein